MDPSGDSRRAAQRQGGVCLRDSRRHVPVHRGCRSIAARVRRGVDPKNGSRLPRRGVWRLAMGQEEHHRAGRRDASRADGRDCDRGGTQGVRVRGTGTVAGHVLQRRRGAGLRLVGVVEARDLGPEPAPEELARRVRGQRRQVAGGVRRREPGGWSHVGRLPAGPGGGRGAMDPAQGDRPGTRAQGDARRVRAAKHAGRRGLGWRQGDHRRRGQGTRCRVERCGGVGRPEA